MIDFLGMAGTQNRQHKIDTVLLISTYYYVLLEEEWNEGFGLAGKRCRRMSSPLLCLLLALFLLFLLSSTDK